MKQLDVRLLNRFLTLACERLKGEWLLVGGTLLPALGVQIRATLDIDLVGLGEKEAAQTLELMEIAEALELPIDTINQAAAFFVKKLGVRKKDLIPLKTSAQTTIYRPSVLLYWRLKLARLSEADALDCEHYLAYCQGQTDAIDKASLKKEVDSHLKGTHPPERAARLERLKRLL